MWASYCAANRSCNIAQDHGVATHRKAVLSIAAVILAMLVGHGSVLAQSDVFLVRDIPADASARSAADARTQALERGRMDALDQLFRRLVPTSFHSQLPDLTARDAIDLVQDFSVANERASSVRYLADLTVRFRPDMIRSTLRFANIPFAETVGKPIVVIPLYQQSIVSDPILWGDPNPWRDAWYELPDADGLVPRQLPFADLQDLTSLKPNDVFARDTALLKQWAGRYGAEDAVIVSAALVGNIGAESIRVTLFFTRSGREQRLNVPAEGEQTWADLFVAAANKAWNIIEDDWKQENMLQFGVTGQITAIVPLNRLEDWLTVKNRLIRVPLIDRYDLQAMTRDRAQVTLYYLGDETQLELAMAQTDLALVWQDEAWVIEDRGKGTENMRKLSGAGPKASIPKQQDGSDGAIASPSLRLPPAAYPSGIFQNNQSAVRP